MLYPAVHLRSSLSLPHDMVKPCLLTTTFTTAAFDRSSLWLFGASPCRATPRGLPSSFVQHEAHASSWHKPSWGLSTTTDHSSKVWELASSEVVATFTCNAAVFSLLATSSRAKKQKTIVAGDALGGRMCLAPGKCELRLSG